MTQVAAFIEPVLIIPPGPRPWSIYPPLSTTYPLYSLPWVHSIHWPQGIVETILEPVVKHPLHGFPPTGVEPEGHVAA